MYFNNHNKIKPYGIPFGIIDGIPDTDKVLSTFHDAVVGKGEGERGTNKEGNKQILSESKKAPEHRTYRLRTTSVIFP